MTKTTDEGEKAPLLRSSSSSASSSLKSYGSRGDLAGTSATAKEEPGLKTPISKKSKQHKKEHGFRDVFRYANAGDYVLMFFGIVFSILHGAGFPILSVVFGGMTNAFLRAEVSNITAKTVREDSYAYTVSLAGTTPSFQDRADVVSTQNPDPLPPIAIDEFLDNVITFSVAYAVIGAGMLITSYAQIACFQSSAERQIVKIRNAFFHSVLRQEISWYDQHQTGELTTRLHDDLERIREGIGDKVTIFVQNVAAFASGFVIGFIYDWKLTLVMMSLTPVLALSGAFVGKMMATASKREQEKYAKAGGIADEVISCIRTVMALNGQQREIQRYKEALDAGRQIGIQKYVYSGAGMFVTFLAMFGSYALAFWYGSRLIATEPGFTPGTVFTVFFAVMAGSFALGNAAPHFSSITTAKGAAMTILEIIDNQPHIDPYCVGGLKPDNVNGKIEFHNVRFAYPVRKDVTVLNGISFKVEPGQNVAIVGASGCGKSTIVSLLLRFYDCDKGQVTIDGYNVKHMNVHWLRGIMGVVSQEPVLFDGTVEENIKLGDLDATKEQVVEAAKMANALQFINTLPEGFNTRVGERGVQLSGGQKQRIAIARALVRDPKILLLDEATSALDAESEEIVQEALGKAQQGRTTITIAHRLSTIKDSSWIYVLQFGCLMEQGTHHDLMEKRSIYYKMVMNQQLDEGNGGYDAETEDAGNDTPGAIGGRTTSSGNEGTAASEPKPFVRRFSSMKGRTRRDSMSDRQRSDHEFGSRSSLVMRKPSYRRSSLSRYSSKKSLSRLQSQDLIRLKEELEEEKVKPTSFTNIYKESRSEWGLMAIGCIGSLLNAVVMPAFALFFSQIFAAYSEQGDKMQQEALFWSMMFLVLGFAQGAGMFISFYFFGRAGENLTMNLRLKVFANILRQDVAYFDDMKHSTGKICTRLASDAPNVRAAMGTRIGFLLSAVISMILGIVVAFIFGWKLALVITAMTPLLVLSAYLDLRLQMDSHKRDTSLLEEAGKTASEAIGNIRTVQALCREHYFYTTYINHLKNPFKAALKNTQLYALGFGVAQSISFFMYAASFRYGGHLISKGEIEPVNVFRIFFAISFCAQSIGQASSFIPDYVKAKMSAGLLFYMMNYEPTIDNCSKAGITPDQVKGQINAKNLHFYYPTRPTVRVLQNLTIHVKPGTTLALVGPSGCGKSTVVSMIERFYDPLSGEIQIDGYDLRTLNLPNARKNISLVSQEPVLFDCSIWDNISYGLEGKITHEQVVQAAKLANIHDFILSLPQGYVTKVGEKGTQLSGGQKQRIAIARSLVRGPKILLLDEATSALDTESERIVQEALDRAREGRTCIMIAHRLSTVQSADCIAVIQDGKVVEKGTHAELIALKGLYSRMTNMQNLMDDS